MFVLLVGLEPSLAQSCQRWGLSSSLLCSMLSWYVLYFNQWTTYIWKTSLTICAIYNNGLFSKYCPPLTGLAHSTRLRPGAQCIWRRKVSHQIKWSEPCELKSLNFGAYVILWNTVNSNSAKWTWKKFGIPGTSMIWKQILKVKILSNYRKYARHRLQSHTSRFPRQPNIYK